MRAALLSPLLSSLLPLLVALAALGAHAAEPSLVLLPLGGDATEHARRAVEARARIAAGRYAALQERGLTEQALRTAGTLGLSCDTGAAPCAAKMGGLAGAARVLFGTLDAQGALVLSLVEVNTEGGAPATERVALPAAGVARDAAIERAVLQLLAPERVLAQLQIVARPPGAHVVVDDVFRGPAPLRAALVLPPGEHHIDVTHPGYVPQSRDVVLETGGSERVLIELEPDAATLARPPQAPDTAVAEGGDAIAPDDDHAAASGTVVVFPFTSERVPTRVVSALDEALAEELERREGLVVLGPRAMAGSLASAPPGCATDEQCLADLARALGVEVFVVGHAEATGDVITLAARRHDTATGMATLAGGTSAFADDRAPLLHAMSGLAAELFPERELADGALPIDAERYLARMEGGRLPPWVFWTAAGVGGALAVATGVAGVAALNATEPADAGRAGAAFAMGAGGTVVVIGAAAVIGVLVNWDDR